MPDRPLWEHTGAINSDDDPGCAAFDVDNLGCTPGTYLSCQLGHGTWPRMPRPRPTNNRHRGPALMGIVTIDTVMFVQYSSDLGSELSTAQPGNLSGA